MPITHSNNSNTGNRVLIVATAGHVDHGKTSLVNRITGSNTDTLAEEKSRGLTINLGYAYHHFTSEEDGNSIENTIGFVDVPGHSDFINNMLAGVGSVDCALLVIAADDGVMPQTREHLAILDLLGISTGIVALTKIDRCSAERIESVSRDINDLLDGTSLQGIDILPVSNETGDGIALLVEKLTAQLVLDSDKTTNHENEYFRFLIDRAFTVKGIGTVVTGSARAGATNTNSILIHSGSSEETRVKAIRLDAMNLQSIHVGQRAAINISLGLDNIHRGDWLVDKAIYNPASRLDCEVRFLDPAFKLRSSAQYHLYLGAAHHVVTLRNLGDTHPGDESPRFYQIKCHETMIANHGDRFVIRDPASRHTIGGGRVIDIHVPRRGRSSSDRLARLSAMSLKDRPALKALLELCPEGIDLDQFSSNRNIRHQALNKLCEELSADEVESIRLDKHVLPVLLHKKYFNRYQQQILDQLSKFHKESSNQQGMSEPALAKAIDFTGSHFLFQAIVQRLIAKESIKSSGTLLHLPDHQTRLSKEEQEFLDKVRPILLKAGNIPPRTRELVEITGIPLKPLERILRQTTRAGNLVKVADNRHYLPETIMKLAEFTEVLAQQNDDGFSVIQFRDSSGIGRNLCIELLEYFDGIGFTRRDGNSRYLRTDRENVFNS